LTELISRATSASADRHAARQQLSGRLAASTLPIVIGFVALGISGFPQRIALFSGCWVLMLYVAALRAAAPTSNHAPALSNVWLVNVVFALGGLGLVCIRPRSDDRGHPHHIDPV
jgi:hypothetical protein